MEMMIDWHGIELGRADFGNDLRDWIAFTIAFAGNVRCGGKAAALKLLYHEADSIIEQVKAGTPPA